MAEEMVGGGRECALTLRGVADIFEATALQAAAVAAIEQAGDIVVQLGELERCDAAVAQILIALRRAAKAEGRSLRFEAIPSAVAADWKATGLDGHLD